MKIVVRREPTRVLVAISLPSNKNARTISKILITVSIIPGEKGRTEARITETPLVPPNSIPHGKTKSRVLMAYKRLPKVIYM